MILTREDYENIARQIEEGKNSVTYDKGDEILQIDCIFETEGSWEDDYYNGTGAYVELARQLTITKAEVCNEDGISKPFDLDAGLLESLVA